MSNDPSDHERAIYHFAPLFLDYLTYLFDSFIRKKIYLLNDALNTFFLYVIWLWTTNKERENLLPPLYGQSAEKDLLNAPCHGQVSTYHNLSYSGFGVLAQTRNR